MGRRAKQTEGEQPDEQPDEGTSQAQTERRALRIRAYLARLLRYKQLPIGHEGRDDKMAAYTALLSQEDPERYAELPDNVDELRALLRRAHNEYLEVKS